MRYILIITLFLISIDADDLKLFNSLKKNLLIKDKRQKDEKINKIFIKDGKEDNITKNIQALINKKKKK
ncbi:MAG TPA: hypothetical protein EYG69_02975 [Campylobacterales bacterium]|nr:hypothetical protein [Campylobacterales bacterium]